MAGETFSFTIPDADLTSLSYTGTLRTETSPGSGIYEVEVVVDRGFQRQVQHRVLTAKFGDGYEQRLLDGINTKNETFSIALNNRPSEEINLIAAFLDLKAGKNFTLEITNLGVTPEQIKVVCDGYNLVYPQPTIHSLQATFRRVYEP